MGAEEKAQLLGTLLVLPQDLSSVLSNHVRGSQLPPMPVLGDLQEHACMFRTLTQICTHKTKEINLLKM